MNGQTLVTGATGLLGNNIVRQLAGRGDTVRVLVREASDTRPLAGLDVEYCHGDVRDAESVRRACRGVSRVIHSAGYVKIGRSELELHRAINVEGTRHVAQAARAEGVRMVHVSSCDAVGVRSLEQPADEETPLAPPVPCSYAITKREAEQVVLAEQDRGLDVVIVNPGFMLGPWDWKPSSGRMLVEVARGRGRFAPRGYFSLCDARDVACGVVAAVERGCAGRRYILAGETLSYLQAWRLFALVANAPQPWLRIGPFISWVAGHVGDVCTRLMGSEPDVNSGALALAQLPKSYSSDRAKRELGYETRPLLDTIQDTWIWFRQHGFA